MSGRALALITGGTSGIGFETAKRLVLRHDLALCYKSNEARAKSALEELRSLDPGARVELYKIHLDSYDASAILVGKIRSTFDRDISLLINNAGALRLGFFLQADFQIFPDSINEHLLVPVALCRLLVPAMYAQKFGRVVNITSAAHHLRNKGQSAYAAAKAALASFTKSLALEVSHRGITVNAVCPALTRTPMTEGLDILRQPPIGRPIEACEVADLVEFLCSDKASAITGAEFLIDGGSTLAGGGGTKRNYIRHLRDASDRNDQIDQ